jgi:hypothetical protein
LFLPQQLRHRSPFVAKSSSNSDGNKRNSVKRDHGSCIMTAFDIQ